MKQIPHIGKCKYCNSSVWYVPIFDERCQHFKYWKVVSSTNIRHECPNNPYNEKKFTGGILND